MIIVLVHPLLLHVVYFAPIMPAFFSLLLPSYYAKKFAGKINTSQARFHAMLLSLT